MEDAKTIGLNLQENKRGTLRLLNILMHFKLKRVIGSAVKKETRKIFFGYPFAFPLIINKIK